MKHHLWIPMDTYGPCEQLSFITEELDFRPLASPAYSRSFLHRQRIASAPRSRWRSWGSRRSWGSGGSGGSSAWRWRFEVFVLAMVLFARMGGSRCGRWRLFHRLRPSAPVVGDLTTVRPQKMIEFNNMEVKTSSNINSKKICNPLSSHNICLFTHLESAAFKCSTCTPNPPLLPPRLCAAHHSHSSSNPPHPPPTPWRWKLPVASAPAVSAPHRAAQAARPCRSDSR